MRVYIATLSLSAFLRVLSTVESGNNVYAYNGKEDAAGILQIRPAVIADVLPRRPGTRLVDRWNPDASFEIATEYLRLWGSEFGHTSAEDIARIWNGGPDGWYSLKTLPYWAKVKREMKRRGLDSRAIITGWQPLQTSPSPAARSAFTLVTTNESSSRSDRETSFSFGLSGAAATVFRCSSPSSTTKPSAPRPAPSPASPPPTLRLARTPYGVDSKGFIVVWPHYTLVPTLEK